MPLAQAIGEVREEGRGVEGNVLVVGGNGGSEALVAALAQVPTQRVTFDPYR